VKTLKPSSKTKLEILFFRIPVLMFSLSILFFNLPLHGQQKQTNATETRSRAVYQQPAKTYRIPDNLYQIQLVTVPLLVGRTYSQDEITALLNKVGLKLGNTVPVENNEKIGIILSQSPGLRQRVRPQTAVDITYGIEAKPIAPELPENVIVPNYVGMNIDQVLGRLPNDRLTLGSNSEVYSDQPVGIVVEQFPPPGTNAAPNTSIALKFSSGPQQVKSVDVPRLIGLTLQEAAEVLKNNQLYAGFLRQAVSDKNAGEVLDQSPPEGTSVSIGSSVDITYSVQVQEEFVIVPDVIGLYPDDARKVLDEVGLQIRDIYSQKSHAREGTVVEQTPRSGEEVKKETPVVLVIAKHNQMPGWMYWVGGICAALILSGYWGWKLGKGNQQKKIREKNDPKLKLVVIHDSGKQTIHSADNSQSISGLQLKIIPDKGVQIIKTN
jgi:beta-lactam-binding protein with PASTA domain